MNETTENHIAQRLRNIFHSLLIVGSMFILLGFTAELVLGATGWWLVFAVLVSILIGVRISPMLVMRLYRAQPLSHRQTPELYSVLHELSERAELEGHAEAFLHSQHSFYRLYHRHTRRFRHCH